MGKGFWIKRYAVVFAVAFIVIAAAQAMKGHTLAYAVTQGLIWAALSAAVFVATAIHRWRRGQHCALCRDPVVSVDDRNGAAS